MSSISLSNHAEPKGNSPSGDIESSGDQCPATSSIKEEREGPESPRDDNPKPKRQVTGIRWALVCLAIYSANLLYGLDTTIAADIQAAISTTFQNTTHLGWLGVGFTLGSTVAILPLGKAFGIFDAKLVFLGSLAMFSAGSALCGAAPSMDAIIVGRAWAGTGGAGMYLGFVSFLYIGKGYS